MKILALAALTLVFSFQSFATTTDDVKKETTEAASAVVEYSKEQKEQFQKDMDANLQKLQLEIADLKKAAAHKSGEAKKEMNEKIKAMEAQQDAIKSDLVKLKKRSGKAWEKMKVGVSKAWDSLSDSYQNAKDELKETK